MKKFFASILAVALVLSLCAVAAYATEVYQGPNEKIPADFVVPQAVGVPTIDGIMDKDFWGEPIMTAVGKDRYEDVMFINPRETFTDEQYNAMANITANYYFRWDKDYLYILVQDNRIFTSEATAKDQPWNNNDCLQIAIGQTPDSIEPHLGFSLVAPQDLTETWVWVFEAMAGTDGAAAEAAIQAKVAFKDGMTTWEMAVPWADALALEGKLDTTFGIGLAFFFNSVEANGLAWQVGRGVFGADKDYNFIPFGKLGAALEAAPAAEEPAAEEPAAEEPAAEEPAAEEPAVDVPVVPEKPSNPTTSDISVIFYALAAVSAVGGLSIFKKR